MFGYLSSLHANQQQGSQEQRRDNHKTWMTKLDKQITYIDTHW